MSGKHIDGSANNVSPAGGHAPVQLYVTNDFAEAMRLVLEPWGEIYVLLPGERRLVTYLGDPAPRLSVDVGRGEMKIWAEGPGELRCDAR